jgi:two-component system chemotaxis response regulator CheY
MNAPYILVADDYAPVRRLIKQTLNRSGYQRLGFADNGRLTVDMALAAPPDLIVLDFDMPKLDGIATLDELRGHPGTQNIPVIMISGMEEFHSCFDAIGRGATHVLEKPFAPSHLMRMVTAALSLTK